MGRISEFDRREVVDAALHQFWAHGFNATSTETLCRVTGLGRSSLYHAFGNKVGLYEECMSTYLADADESVDAVLTHERVTVLERIAILFDDLIDSEMTRRTSGGPSGCFSVNTALEAADDPQLAVPHRQVTDNLHKRLEILADHLRAGQAGGDISVSLTPSAQAEVVNGAVVGIRVASRVGSQREALRAIADGAMMVLTP
ncbi:TetR family transcriptional regulator [Rhodococcus sp. 06-235-1A]|uniref:TetR/AcrR family transcriptional regulator n=1 Tax=Rhodococcus sp. 06-235-1A TaxID=2022508 RepID=UPI000B9A803A|nr:TetR/AcrR family transcriptional regulator [Rhodococcus sp. 06-235-1A]OZD01739.1 TetR family transcriptional regulator [Rhodococcus sp. 06-235-1A]